MAQVVKRHVGAAALLIGVTVLAACASQPQARGAGAGSGGAIPLAQRVPSLASAERAAQDLGTVSPQMTISGALTLTSRDQQGLSALLADGGRVSPAEYAQRFGPDPHAVASVQRVLQGSGMRTTWQPGAMELTLSGDAAAMEALFSVRIDDFRSPDGSAFQAPRTEPVIPAALRPEVVAVTGLDTYRGHVIHAVGANGIPPNQMMSIYDVTPLRSAGLDGTGITVMFPEWAMPDTSVLTAYAQRFGLPPFNVQVKTDPSWGQPDSSKSDGAAGEAAMDLEIVHGLAPGAREIVYELGDTSQLPAVMRTMVTQNPGAIMSSSIGVINCTADPGAEDADNAEQSVFEAAAAQGTSIFWASGDRGAYSCLAGTDTSEFGDLAVTDGSGDGVTTVGGTTLIPAANGGYFGETAWASVFEQWGGAGGFVPFYPRPAWQVGPGVSGAHRGVPDVSADADIASGWDIMNPTDQGAQEGSSGGTSAAAPCWAAITALIDQDLAQKHLPSVGFANPALYYFAQKPAGLPATAFHDITEGNNLHYVAAPGWDAATGLGSPDAGALADDFEWYATHKPSGGA